ncbi:MAG: signal peptide peptidase SppA, partial [Mucilaginibacter sp.]
MKQFFKFVLATFVGMLIFTAIVVVIIGVVIGAIVASASSDKHVEIDSNSILHIAFTSSIPERTPNNPLAGLSFLGIDGD